MLKRCSKCGGNLKVQLDTPFLTNYVCCECNAAFPEVKDAKYPFRSMNPRKVRRHI
jgi:hypothetical protein